MTGERLAWYVLADRLGMSLQRCQQETTSSQFVEWQEYIAWDLEQHKREDFYLAQIAQLIRQGQVRNPRSVKLVHYLLNLTTRTQKQRPLTKTEKRRRLANSKAYWFGVAGYKPQPPPDTER